MHRLRLSHPLLITLVALTSCTPEAHPPVEGPPNAGLPDIARDPGPAFSDIPGGYQSESRPFSAQFSASGVRIQPRAAHAPFEMSFEGVSRTSVLPGQRRVSPRIGVAERRGLVEYDHGSVIEWWNSAHDGLQQGWDLIDRPPGEGPLMFNIAVYGAEVEVGSNSQEALLVTPSGNTYRYGDVFAWDALGEPLPAIIEADGTELRVVVDDTDAAYPIAVDPWMSQLIWTQDGLSNAYFGYHVAMAGDTNNDGFGDVVVGAPVESPDGTAYVYYGCPNTTCTTGINPSYTKIVPSINGNFGARVAAGDFSGDGYNDVAVSAPNYSGNYASAGAVQVFKGGFNGIDATAWWTYTGPNANMMMGWGLAAGDFNADGIDDLAVGSPYYTNNQSFGGQVDIFRGDPNGLTLVHTLQGPLNSNFGTGLAAGYNNLDAAADLLIGAPNAPGGSLSVAGMVYLYRGSGNGLPASPTWSAYGNEDNAGFGTSVAILQDTNGDSLGDLLIGAPFHDTANHVDAGRIYNYSGKLDDTILDQGFSTQDYANLGQSVSNAGDISQDGYGDAIVGAPNLKDTVENEGAAIAFESDGAGVLKRTTTMYGNAAGQLGISVSGNGDVNGDGYPDAVVGMPYYNNLGGRVQVFLGDRDSDGDSVVRTEDCNDNDPSIYPGATEVVGDSIDQNCDGKETCYIDADNDNQRTLDGTTLTSSDSDCKDKGEGLNTDPATDCNDGIATIYAGATEVVADSIDQDCDSVDSCYTDSDNDNYGTAIMVDGSSLSCTTGTGAPVSTDCDDGDSADYPGAAETVANGDDEDCDGVDSCYTDVDNDNYGTAVVVDGSTLNCTTGTGAPVATDCDDADSGDYPGATETVGNGDDEDCDGKEGCYANADGDGYRTASTIASADFDCNDAGEALSAVPSPDCDDNDASDYPGATETVGNGDDEDCDGKETCYVNADGDTYRLATTVVSSDSDCADAGEALSSVLTTDCDDADASDYPGATETVGNGDDESCDGKETCYVNADGDAYRLTSTVASSDADCSDAGEALSSVLTTDCDDADAGDYPGATETVGNGDDEDCDGKEGCYANADGDAYRTASTIASTDFDCNDTGEALSTMPSPDCDDADPGDYPGATEIIGNSDDEDCDSVDDCYTDADGDNYGTAVVLDGLTLNCVTDSGRAAVTGDCDDASNTDYPSATETVGNNDDEDCDGVDDCYTDADGDNYGTSVVIDGLTTNCTTDTGRAPANGDCNDGSSGIYPTATETVGDSVDQDCSGTETCYADADDDGYRPDSSSTVVSADTDCLDSAEAGSSDPTGDCNDSNSAISPGTSETPVNGVDENCDGKEICYNDGDYDGYGETPVTTTDLGCDDSGHSMSSQDCDDATFAVHPNATEVCNDIDDDCDEVTDLDAVDRTTLYLDADGDGYGVITSSITNCGPLAGYTLFPGDCNDGNTGIHPGATEACDSKDDLNCDGSTGYTDGDGDGFAACEECDDDNALIHPDAEELCNQEDDNCDGEIDEDSAIDALTWYVDGDDDGYGSTDDTVLACTQPGNAAAEDGDCDDEDDAIFPGAPEPSCSDPTDYNCDGKVTFEDNDDGSAACVDCNDNNADVHPGAEELCNEIDDDCDDEIDGPDATGGPDWYTDADGDSYGDDETVVQSCEPLDGKVQVGGDCDDDNPAFHPGAEESDCTDPNDYNCDGLPSSVDADNDGFAACGDCDDNQPLIFPDAIEKCGNALDDNCDGEADEGCPSTDEDPATCGCASAPPAPPLFAAWAAIAGLWLRRRRSR